MFGGEQFQATRYTFPSELTKFDARGNGVVASDAEAFLAEFLLQQGRHDEASARLVAAASSIRTTSA